MQPRWILLLLVSVLVTSAAMGASVRDRAIPVADRPSEADRVVFYQNGLVAVNLDRTFVSDGSEQVLRFTVPASTILDSVRLSGDGVVVREFRSSLQPRAIVAEGDAVTARVGDQTFSGHVLSLRGGQLLLQVRNDTVVLQQEAVTAITIHGVRRAEAPEGSAQVQVAVKAPAGNRTVRLSYVAQGAGWTPSYALDVKTGALTLFASLTAIADWRGIQVAVVSGSPHVVYEGDVFGGRGGGYEMRLATAPMAQTAGASYDTAFSPAQQMGDLHRYTYAHRVTVERDELVRLPLLAGRLDVLRHYYEGHAGAHDQLTPLAERYHVRSAVKDPLPAGTVRLYDGDDWLASDRLPALAPGEEGNLTASMSAQVKLQVRHVGHETQTLRERKCSEEHYKCISGQARDTDRFTLTVRNHKQEPVEVRLHFSPPHDAKVVRVEPQPDERRGATLVWDERVAAGKEAQFRVTTERTYET
ncbi:MAG TPA: DUF4139 domain-containing protein [Candidatus Thermoplasmatota archaeon]|nr:DUF4139 domain-containing protein [Candidatus Thermoplasmatota archaeon]